MQQEVVVRKKLVECMILAISKFWVMVNSGYTHGVDSHSGVNMKVYGGKVKE